MNRNTLFPLLLGALAAACQSNGIGGDERANQAGDAKVTAKVPESATYDQPGFAVYERDGRLWIFKDGSEGHKTFLEHGEPAKCITKIGAGPDGKTVKGAEMDTLNEYLGK